MPYVTSDTRDKVHSGLRDEGTNWVPENAGELNYLISSLIANFLYDNGVNYKNINEMVGALECAKTEFNRVIVGPYEDKKIKENGDVYLGIL